MDLILATVYNDELPRQKTINYFDLLKQKVLLWMKRLRHLAIWLITDLLVIIDNIGPSFQPSFCIIELNINKKHWMIIIYEKMKLQKIL